MKEEIRIISSEIAYKGKWLTIRKDEIISFNEINATNEVLERNDIVLIVPREKDFFYFVEQYRYAVRSRSLEFPQGFVNAGETPLEAAKRELKEETGFDAKYIELLNIIWPMAGYSNQTLHIFFSEDFEKGEQNLDHTEKGLGIKKVPYKQIDELIRKGAIKNGPTLAALSVLHSQKAVRKLKFD